MAQFNSSLKGESRLPFEAAQATGAASPVYFLLHMPRTAGNTIAAHLRLHLREQVWSPAPPSPVALLRRGSDYLRNAPDLGQVRVVTGHHLRRSFERHFSGRIIRRTLLLRDPISFHVSYYNHRMMFLLSRGGQTCGFGHHFAKQPRDLIAQILLWHWLELSPLTMLSTGDEEKYRLLNEALAGFWFVGSYHDCDRLLAAVAQDLGIPASAPRRNTTDQWQKRVDWQPLRVADLTPPMRDLILERNPVHEALWQSWRHAAFDAAGSAPLDFRASESGEIGARDLIGAIIADRAIPPLWQKTARAVRTRDWPRAAALYRKAVGQAPGLPEIWLQYGHVLKESGDFAGAESAYRHAADLDRDAAECHLFLGHALLLQGRTEEAREAYRRFESLDPAGLDQRIDELVASGWPKEEVVTFWRSLTEDPKASLTERSGDPA